MGPLDAKKAGNGSPLTKTENEAVDIHWRTNSIHRGGKFVASLITNLNEPNYTTTFYWSSYLLNKDER